MTDRQPRPTGGPDNSDDAAPDAAPRGRRRRHRRVTGGRAPDPDLALNDPVLSGEPGDPDRGVAGVSEATSDREHERWLKEQRPPHWG